MGRSISKHDFWIARLAEDPEAWARLGPQIGATREVHALPGVTEAERAPTAVELMRKLGAQYERFVPVRCAMTLSVQDEAVQWPSRREAWGKRYSDETVKPEPPPVDRSDVRLTSGLPVPEDQSHTEITASGQQKAYVVLSEAERAKGFVRLFRDAYRHVGTRPVHETRPLTEEEQARHNGAGYVAFEPYPEGYHGSATGRYWTQAQLDRGCGNITTMSRDLAATYARDPTFYSGTFCTTCRAHFPVGESGEFVWIEADGLDGPRVGT